MKIDDKTSHNSPSLRFPEFTGEWERCVLGDVLEFSNTRINSSELNSGNYVSTENILQNFQGIVKARSIPEDTNVMAFSCGNILLSNIRPYLKKVWKATFNGGCSSDVFVLQANSNIDADYLHYVVANDKFIGFVMNGAKGVKMPRGDKNQMKTYSLSLPSIKEQRKISRFLSFLDERIAVQNRLIEKYESLIKALAHEIIGKNAPNTMLSECVCCTSSTLKESDLSDAGAVPAYGAAGISGFIDSALSDGDSILITKDGSGVGSLRYVVGHHSFVGTLNSMTPKEGVYLPYIYYALQNVCFESYRTGQAIPHIYFKDYGKEALYCPSFDDQKRLAKGLEMIDAKIGIERAAIQNLQLVKAYLLSAMFI